MARIFITGSADGLGQLAAKLLVSQGHRVVLHARNAERGRVAMEKVPGAEQVLLGDLSVNEETISLAEKVNAAGHFDAIIHNAAVYQSQASEILAVNSLAPYILTCLIHKPERLIYMSSGMHHQGNPNLQNLSGTPVRCSYSDSKLHLLILTKAIARKWPDVYANAVNPGWVPTKMGGPNAPDNLNEGSETQAWLAVSNTDEARVSGRYFFHKKEKYYSEAADDVIIQDKLLSLFEKISGIRFQ
jgi:NAD(P)-dependent dehydrogenase (short-subunit alcohol dehydrogenase family)